jgi:uncharacterized membrane protein YkvA (DUF1232 family)
VLERWKEKARALKREVHALYFACRDPRVPWYAKALAIAVVAYALSPIDLIPDFIPVLGLLDDLLVVPLGVMAVRRMIDVAILEECRQRAVQAKAAPRSWVAAAVIVLLWLAAAAAFAAWLL